MVSPFFVSSSSTS